MGIISDLVSEIIEESSPKQPGPGTSFVITDEHGTTRQVEVGTDMPEVGFSNFYVGSFV